MGWVVMKLIAGAQLQGFHATFAGQVVREMALVETA